MNAYMISVVFLFITSFLHPIHITVTDINFDQERSALEIVSKVFLDDLESEIRSLKKEEYLDITKPGEKRTTDDLLRPYIKERFKVMVNGKEVECVYLGHEVETEAIYLYLEVEKVKKFKSISVENTVLLNFFDDQVNMVHVKVDGKLRSMKIESGEEVGTLEYDN
ncbi:DUF6702 family protein [Fulvivirga sp.]|uniref:DUF6702 family protein n=1 Tax=Fulvivirga sp. TaxID=1931237 RepID=UPI0032ED55D7